MPTINIKAGTQIFYKDWGSGQPIVFSHGWPLTADDWDSQMMFFGGHGYRVIAHDRRGHGRSTQTWDGNDMDTYADDLAALTEKLDLKDAIHIGHSTGGGEVARYIGRHGSKRVAMAVLISSVPPLMVKTDKNPAGLPIEVFDGLRDAYSKNRPQFYRDITLPFYGYNRPGAEIYPMSPRPPRRSRQLLPTGSFRLRSNSWTISPSGRSRISAARGSPWMPRRFS